MSACVHNGEWASQRQSWSLQPATTVQPYHCFRAQDAVAEKELHTQVRKNPNIVFRIIKDERTLSPPFAASLKEVWVKLHDRCAQLICRCPPSATRDRAFWCPRAVWFPDQAQTRIRSFVHRRLLPSRKQQSFALDPDTGRATGPIRGYFGPSNVGPPFSAPTTGEGPMQLIVGFSACRTTGACNMNCTI